MAYTQQAGPLIGTGYTGQPLQGWSAAVSSDGNTLAIGGPYDNSNLGAFWVYKRSLGNWTQIGGPLVGTGYTGQSVQGWSVALSGDGNTIAIGGPLDDPQPGSVGIGAVWIFTRFLDVWTQDGTKLVGTGYVVGSLGVYQGYDVALNYDGTTLASGGYQDNSGRGATWIFTKSGGTWSQQGTKLVGTGYTVPGSSWQGASVALSSDGDTLAVGGPINNTSIGATWIFTRSGGTWTQQAGPLVGTGYTPSPFGPGTPFQGQSVALSSDGDTLAVGGPQDNDYIGATWIFTRSGGTWTQQGTKLVGTGYLGTPNFGWSVSLGGDGNTLAVGGRFDNPDPLDDQLSIGATWIFTRSGGTWTQQGTKLVGTGYTGLNILQGSSVSLSSDSSTLAIGGTGNDTNIGAAWVFSSGATPTTTTTTAAPGTTTTTTAAPGPTIIQYTLRNTGTEGLTIQSMNFNDPPNIGHIANLVNLGGSSNVTGNASLSYNFPANATQTFTLDYTNSGASPGTYNGNVIIGGSDGTSQTIRSTITIAGSGGTTTTTTAAPSGLGFSPNISFDSESDNGGRACVAGVRFETDGSISRSLNGSQTVFVGPDQFLATITPGAAAGYSVRARMTAYNIEGAGTYAIFGTSYPVTPPTTDWSAWYNLSAFRVISASVPSYSSGLNSCELNFDVEIRNDTTNETISNTGYFSVT
jgi:hypothetical protein